MASWRILNRSSGHVMNNLCGSFRSNAAVARPVSGSGRAFTTGAQIRHSDDQEHGCRPNDVLPPKLFSGPLKSVGLVVPGENPSSETRRLLLPTLQSNFYGYNNNINAQNICVPHRYYCCGSNFGWLIMIDSSLDTHLYNPLSGSKIQLPSLTTSDPDKWYMEKFGYCFVDKVVLSCEPVPDLSSQTYVLMFFYGNLMYCKVGDEVWRVICKYDGDIAGHNEGVRGYMDAVYYKDKFYVVDSPGQLTTIDINANANVTMYDKTPRGSRVGRHLHYLVESNGELFQIKRYVDLDDTGKSIYNQVFPDSENENNDEDEDEKEGEDREVDTEANGAENNTEGSDVEVEKNGDGGEAQEHGYSECDCEDDSAEGNNQDNDADKDGEFKCCPCCGGKLVAFDDLDLEFTRYLRTTAFKVFKLREGEGGGQEWEEVDDIGDRAFFVGRSGSFSLSTLENPGYKPNSIYFTPNKFQEMGWPEPVHHDIGVFKLEDQTFEHIYPVDSKPMKPTPFWYWHCCKTN